MNLNNQPTIDQLAQLFAARKDTLDNHILWVSDAGDVHIDRLSTCDEEEQFLQSHPDMCARLRTYRRGQGYVGRKAAADKDFLGRVLQTLQDEWPNAQQHGGVREVDRYC